MSMHASTNIYSLINLHTGNGVIFPTSWPPCFGSMWLLISLVLAGPVAVISAPSPPSVSFSLSSFPLDPLDLNNVSEFSCARECVSQLSIATGIEVILSAKARLMFEGVGEIEKKNRVS